MHNEKQGKEHMFNDDSLLFELLSEYSIHYHEKIIPSPCFLLLYRSTLVIRTYKARDKI